MEWIHCNSCYRQPRSRHNDFIMTSCGHILCKRCENRESIDSCLVCKAKCRILPLSGSMKPELRTYFEDIETQLNAIIKVIRFQNTHRVNLFRKQVRVVESYQSVKVENNLLRKKLLEAEKKIQSLEKLKERYIYKTPGRSSNAVPTSRHTGHFSDPRTPAQDVFENTHAAFQHIQPHLRKYNNYRVKNTPTAYNTTVPSDLSGFARSFHRQAANSAFPKPQETPLAPTRRRIPRNSTPPYNLIRGIDMRR